MPYLAYDKSVFERIEANWRNCKYVHHHFYVLRDPRHFHYIPLEWTFFSHQTVQIICCGITAAVFRVFFVSTSQKFSFVTCFAECFFFFVFKFKVYLYTEISRHGIKTIKVFVILIGCLNVKKSVLHIKPQNLFNDCQRMCVYAAVAPKNYVLM